MTRVNAHRRDACLFLRRNAALIGFFSAFAAPLQAADEAKPNSCHASVAYLFEDVNDWYSGLHSSMSIDSAFGLHINDQLFRARTDEIEPGVLKSISKDDATNTVTLTLDETCKWSNGRPITAADVKAGLEAVFSPNSSGAVPRQGLLPNGEEVYAGELPASALGIKVVDDTHLQFQSELGTQTITDFFGAVYYMPLPSWLIEEDPEYLSRNEVPEIFSGPYMVKSYEPSKVAKVELVANPHFCGMRPFFDHVDMVATEKVEFFIEMAAQDEDMIGFMSAVSSEFSKEISTIDWINERFEAVGRDGSSIAFFRLNATHGPFKDQELRRAFIKAIDWEGPQGADSRLVYDGSRRTVSPSLVPIRYMPDAPLFQRDTRPREERLAEARKILEEHGYNDENPLVLTAAFTNYQRDQYYPIEEMIEQGLPIVMEETIIEAQADYYRDVFLTPSTDFDVSLADWGIPRNWPLFYIEFYFNNNILSEEFKASGDPYLDIIRKSSDADEVDRAERDALQLILDQDIYIPFFQDGWMYLLERDVEYFNRSYASTVWDMAYKDPSKCNQ